MTSRLGTGKSVTFFCSVLLNFPPHSSMHHTLTKLWYDNEWQENVSSHFTQLNVDKKYIFLDWKYNLRAAPGGSSQG
jgi:hypothetical protein